MAGFKLAAPPKLKAGGMVGSASRFLKMPKLPATARVRALPALRQTPKAVEKYLI
jgi:hypothetical protein